MSKNIWRYLGAVVLCAALGALTVLAQDKSEMSTKAKGQSITGCVQKGEEPGGFTLKADNGTTYELMSDSVNVGDHVGHKVTLTGHKVHASKAEEQQKETAEKKEAGDGKYTDFKVNDLKMVSESCQ